MLDKLSRRSAIAWFDWQCRGILRTPPVRLRPAPLQVVSMVRTEHVRMYLLAIKSLYRYLPGGAVSVIDDGSLSAADKALLADHVGGLAIVPITAIATAPCPVGGTWERLLHILDRSADSYVLQMDSDILASAPIEAVAEAIAGNISFTLNSGEGLGIVTLEQAAEAVAGGDLKHLQMRAEHELPRLPAALPGRRYVRGSSGFAGFGRGALTRRDAEAFSGAMQDLLGARWNEWGSEQITGNYLIANAPGGRVLPWPTYACFDANLDPAGSRLLHFVGSWRFDRGVYAERARRLIAELGTA